VTLATAPSRPVLRWHGGKWLLSRKILPFFPPHRIYTESFGGAASILLRKPRSYAEIYNDLDGDVVNLFRVLQDPVSGARLQELLRITPFAREEFKLAYADTQDPVERARRLIIRSFMGFGSNACNRMTTTGFRANSNRSGTTPAYDWSNYPECLGAIIERFRGVVVECRPAVEVLKQHDQPDALHYVDPPYLHSTRRQGQQKNYRYEMSEADHIALAEVLKTLQGQVILSGYPSELYDNLYAGWGRHEINAFADGARPRTEVLWIKR
jgi:DNA adenine methylase